MALLWLNFRSSVIVISKMLGDLLKIQIVDNKAKGEFKNGGNKKTNNAKFSEKTRTFISPWYTHVRVRIRGQKMFGIFFRKIWRDLFSCYLRFEICLLPYYRLNAPQASQKWFKYLVSLRLIKCDAFRNLVLFVQF